MKVRIGTVDLHRLVPHHRLQPLTRLPVKLDERRHAFGIHQAEAMNAETLHRAE